MAMDRNDEKAAGNKFHHHRHHRHRHIIIIITTTTIIISITTASLQVALASGYGSFDFAKNAAKRLWERPKGGRRPRPR